MNKVILASTIFLLAAGCSKSTPETVTTNVNKIPGKTFTMAEVEKANTPENCYSAINGKVYDLTAWINQHPGGDKNILRICGKDGSSAYNGEHGGDSKPEKILAGFDIGDLK